MSPRGGASLRDECRAEGGGHFGREIALAGAPNSIAAQLVHHRGKACGANELNVLVPSEQRDSARFAPDHERISFFGMLRYRRCHGVAILDELHRALDEAEMFRQSEKRRV
jgi:hypothetical protein